MTQLEAADKVIESALKHNELVFDVENSGELFGANFDLWGVSFGTRDLAVYLTDPEAYIKVIDSVFNTDCLIIAHNISYDLKVIKKCDLIKDYPKNIADTMTAANLLYETKRENELGLKKLVLDLYKHQMAEFADASKAGKNNPDFCKYSAEDSKWTYKLWAEFYPKLQLQKLDKIFFKILMEAKKLFADIESFGIGWDMAKANTLKTLYENKIAELETGIYKELGSGINLNSGDQLATRLFGDLKFSTVGVPLTNSGKRFQVNEEVLETLAPRYPVCDLLLERRKATKVISTYINGINEAALINVDLRCRARYALESTTGRTRSSNPNLQNIIKIKDPTLSVKQCFVPRPGFTFGCADMSQIELRVCSHISGDPKMSAAYLNWQCTKCKSAGASNIILHSCPKCGAEENEKILKNKTIEAFWHGLDLHTQTTDNIPALGGDRDYGKQSNFALIYLATAKRMHYSFPRLSIHGWQAVIDQFFSVYTGVARWHKALELQMKTQQRVYDIFGRQRRIEKWEFQGAKYKHALNMFTNFPVQASATNLTLIGCNKLRAELMAKGYWGTHFFFTNFVHDEIDFEVSLERKDEIHEIIQRNLEHAVKLNVPVRVDIKYGNNWHEAKGA